MDIVLIDCPAGVKVIVAGRVLVYAEDSANACCFNGDYDAEWVAGQLARAAGVSARIHRVTLPTGFHVSDEDGPLPSFTPEDVARWWVATCDAQAEEAAMAAPPPTYPTIAEQILGVVTYAGLEITDEVRRLAMALEHAALVGPSHFSED